MEKTLEIKISEMQVGDKLYHKGYWTPVTEAPEWKLGKRGGGMWHYKVGGELELHNGVYTGGLVTVKRQIAEAK